MYPEVFDFAPLHSHRHCAQTDGYLLIIVTLSATQDPDSCRGTECSCSSFVRVAKCSMYWPMFNK